MVCEHCGARLPDSSRFCPECGHSLTSRPAPQQNEGGVRLRVGRPTSTAPGYGGEPSGPARSTSPEPVSSVPASGNAPASDASPVTSDFVHADKPAETVRSEARRVSPEPAEAPAEPDVPVSAPLFERGADSPRSPASAGTEEPTIPFAAVRPAKGERPSLSAETPRPADAAPAAPEAEYDLPDEDEDGDMKTYEPKKPSRARVWTAPTGTNGGLSGTIPPAAQPSAPTPARPAATSAPTPARPAAPSAPSSARPAASSAPTAPRQTAGYAPAQSSRTPSAAPAAQTRASAKTASAPRPAASANTSDKRSSPDTSARQEGDGTFERRRLMIVAGVCAAAAVLLAVCLLLISKCGGSAVIHGTASSSVSGSQTSGSEPSSENVYTAPTVPDVIGKTAEEAEQLIAEAGYACLVGERYDDSVEIGLVAETVPAAGEALEKGGTVTVYLSLGADMSDTAVVWSESAIESAVRIALGRGTGELVVSDLDLVTTLVLDGGDCRVNTEETEKSEDSSGTLSLSDLQYFRNLEALYIYGENVSSLEVLRTMPSLRTLVVDGGTVSDLTPLSGLSSLESVTVTDCAVTSAEPLGELSSLTLLDLSGNPLDGFDSLAGLTGLRILRLNRCGVSDLLPLVSLGELSELRLEENGITDVEALTGLHELTALSLAGNSLTDLGDISAMTSLVMLDLSDNGLSSIAGLEALTAMEALDLSDNSLTSIGELSSMTRLKTLYIDHMSIKDVTPLYSCRSLTYISALRAKSGVASFADPFRELRERLPDCEIVR